MRRMASRFCALYSVRMLGRLWRNYSAGVWLMPRRPVVVHAVAVAILAVAFLVTDADAMPLSLILVGAPWSVPLWTLLLMLPWMLPLATIYHGIELMLIAAAVLNVGLHALPPRRGYLFQIARRPPVLITAVTGVAFVVAIPLGAYASYLGGGPTATLLVLIGGLVVPVSVAMIGVGRHRRKVA